MTRIRVYHNNNPRDAMCFGYREADTVTEVFAYDADHGHTMARLAADAFDLLNIGDDPDFGEPDKRAVEYRRLRNRSLSVGDVLAIDAAPATTVWLACARFGWDSIAEPAVRNTSRHGTTPWPQEGH